MYYTVPGLSMQAIFLKAVDLGQLSVQVETLHSDELTSVLRILVHSDKLTRQKFWERKIVLANGISQILGKLRIFLKKWKIVWKLRTIWKLQNYPENAKR